MAKNAAALRQPCALWRPAAAPCGAAPARQMTSGGSSPGGPRKKPNRTATPWTTRVAGRAMARLAKEQKKLAIHMANF